MNLRGRTNNLIHSPIGEAFAMLAAHTPRRQLLNLSQAAPSFPPPTVMQEHVAKVAFEADGARYVPQEGLGALREAFARELSRDHDCELDYSNVIITAGCNQGFCVVSSALTNPGDNVIVFLPYYFNHDMWLKVEGVERRYVNHGDSLGEIAAKIDERTKAILVVSPGNPSGVVFEPQLIHALFELCVSHNIWLWLDETYRNFRGTTAASHDLYNIDSWENNLCTLHSFSKDLAIPGYRVGAVVGGDAMLAEAMKLLDCVAICAPRIGQEAALAGLLEATEWRDEQSQRIEALHIKFKQMMAKKPGGFELISSGAYFGWVKHSMIDRESNKPHKSLQVVKSLLVDQDVLCIPGTAFTPTDQAMLRFSFANLQSHQVQELGERLAERA